VLTDSRRVSVINAPAGVPESCYCAQFLDHLHGQRGARGPVRLRRGGLAMMDEAPGITRAWGPSGIA
jgi:hypothetical protein